ncbi:MAG TPA: VWA domain-containing protein [Bacteroidales bacterium]|nr:VWA domain-containing protein [Bacteroidales bacterium]
MQFADPQWFYLLILLPVLAGWDLYRLGRKQPDLRLSQLRIFAGAGQSFRIYLMYALPVLRMLAMALLIMALARPQSSSSRQDVTIEGIDIVMALDVSTSMLAEDLKPNRLEAAKRVASDFTLGRPNDRIGLVIFSGEAFTQCPLTTDHRVLRELFGGVTTGLIDDGTAIGDGLATAVNRLKESTAISRVIILLTDGENNMGVLDPVSAAEIARVFGIRIYTIGVGTRGMAPYPFQTPFGRQYQNVEVKIDEALLEKVADMTGGMYFRATNNRTLESIYQEIDQMEKSRIDVTEFHKKYEEFYWPALLGLLLILLEFFTRNLFLRITP